MVKNIHSKPFSGKKLAAYTLVEESPNKVSGTNGQSESAKVPSTENSCQESESSEDYDTSYDQEDIAKGFVFQSVSLVNNESTKRKALQSPIMDTSKVEKKKKLNKIKV